MFGGPLDRRQMNDIPAETETMKIPATLSVAPKYAEYRRAGDGLDTNGPYLRFDFWAVHHNLLI